jgi:hypothetical protein
MGRWQMIGIGLGPWWWMSFCIFIRCCYITVDSLTPALWNGACSKRWISEQMRQKLLMFHNSSIRNRDCHEMTLLFYTFRSKQTRCDSTHVTEQYLANCPKLLKLRPLKSKYLKIAAINIFNSFNINFTLNVNLDKSHSIIFVRMAIS